MKQISTVENESLPRKINFGCGTNFLTGYLNLDANINHTKNCDGFHVYEGELLNPQLLPNDHFEHIKAQMVLEHIHPDIIPTVIYTMSCLLIDGGTVEVTVPDFEFFMRNIPKGPFDIQKLVFMREATFQLLDPVFKSDYSNTHRGHSSLWTLELAKFWFESEGFSVKKKRSERKIPVLEFVATKTNSFSVAKGLISEGGE